jgi:DNA-binding response OmpR family regulator
LSQTATHPEIPPVRVAILDDDPGMQTLLQRVLIPAFQPIIARSGRELMSLAEAGIPDLVLLDLRLPGEDGLEILRRLRESHPVPTLILSGTTTPSTIEAGLNLGADDYITKPFAPQVLLARMRAVMRRTGSRRESAQPNAPTSVRLEGATFYPTMRVLVSSSQQQYSVTERESQILNILCRSGTAIVSRDEISRQITGADWDPEDRSLDVHMCRLRGKLGKATGERVSIDPVRGIGYRLRQAVPLEN